MKKLILILICLIFSNAIFAQKMSENELAKLRNQGVEAFNDNSLKDAVGHFTKIINAKPDYLVYCLRAEGFGRQKNTKAEIADYFQAIKLLPVSETEMKQLAEKYDNVAYLWARDLLAGDAFDESIAAYKKFIAANPKNAEALIVLGFVEQKKGMMSLKMDLAIENYSAAIKLKPTEFLSYRLRGKAFQLENNLDKALQDYSVYLKSNPSFRPTFLKLRAYNFSRKKDFKNAILDYNELLKIQPQNVEFLQARGENFVENKEFDNAIKDFSKALQLISKEKDWIKFEILTSKKATAYFIKKDFQNAAAGFSELLKTRPNDVNSLLFRASCYNGLGDKEKARADLQKIIEINPDLAKRADVAGLIQQLDKKP